MKKLKRIIAILLILFFQADLVGQFVGASSVAWMRYLVTYRAWAATDYHAATGVGSDSVTCANADGSSPLSSHSKATIHGAMACMVSGDRTVVHAGTYNEKLANYTGAGCPTPAANFVSGASTNPTRLHTFGTDIVTLFPTSNSGCGVVGFTGVVSWIEIKGKFILDGTNVSSGSSAVNFDNGATFITFDGVEIKNTNQSGVGADGAIEFGNGVLVGATDITFRNCDIHDNGKGVDATGGAGYGIYWASARGLIEHCKIHHNGGFGVQMFNSGTNQATNDSIIRWSDLYANGQTATKVEGNLIASSGQRVKIYGNIFRDYAGNGPGVQLGTASGLSWADFIFANNTIYNNPGCIHLYPGITTVSVKNDICASNTVRGGTEGITDFGATSYTASTNLCSTSGTGCSTVANPRFADAPNADFRLCKGAGDPHANCTVASPAIDAGVDLSASTSNLDYVGTTRPQGSAWDIGAYEAGGVAPPTPPPPALIASYSFDTDGSTFTDKTGNGHTATKQGGAGWTASGKYNGAISLDGVNDYLSVVDANDLDFALGFTIDGWVKRKDATNSFQALATKNDSTGTSYVYWTYASTVATFCTNSGPVVGYTVTSSVNACYATALTNGAYQHVSMTYNQPAALLSIHIDGITVTTAIANAVIPATTGELRIGASVFGEYCNCDIDNLRIYNYARSNITGSGTCGGGRSEVQCDRDTPIEPVVAPSSPSGIQLGSTGKLELGTGGLFTIGTIPQ